MKSYEIARLFERMADVLELTGDNPLRIRAYAGHLETLSEDVETLAREGRLEEIPGVGADLAGKIAEYLRTGRIDGPCSARARRGRAPRPGRLSHVNGGSGFRSGAAPHGDRHLAGRGIRDRRVLAAMAAVPRERFIDPGQAPFAYDDGPLPIGEGQTISQPYIVARMIEALRLAPTDRVLEIGPGSGYVAAVLAELAAAVYTVERIAALADRARRHLVALGYVSVHARAGDGSLGWPEHGPYDAIVATAGGPSVPPALLEQLAPGGRLVMPVGSMLYDQRLVRVVRAGPGDYRREELEAVAFVPLIGAQGWPEREERRR